MCPMCKYVTSQLVAADPDTADNGRVQYEVKSSHGQFNIHPQTGTVFGQGPAHANNHFDLLVSTSLYLYHCTWLWQNQTI